MWSLPLKNVSEFRLFKNYLNPPYTGVFDYNEMIRIRVPDVPLLDCKGESNEDIRYSYASCHVYIRAWCCIRGGMQWRLPHALI